MGRLPGWWRCGHCKDGIGEMKRLFVQPGFQGKGLDTLSTMETAVALYRQMGFV